MTNLIYERYTIKKPKTNKVFLRIAEKHIFKDWEKKEDLAVKIDEYLYGK